MRILDRYIFRSIFVIFIATIFTFCFLYVLIDSFSNLEDFVEKKIPIEIILDYYLSFLPIIVVNTSPIACLMATLFTFSNLNSNNEIIALRASGLSFFQITKPAIFFGLIVSALIFYINERFVPQSTLMTQEIRTERIKATTTVNTNLIKSLTFYGLQNRLYFIDTFDPDKKEVTGITIIGHDQNQNLREKVVAYKGNWTGLAWKFYQVQIATHDTERPNIPPDIKYYKEKLMDIKETPEDFLRQRITVASMNMRQLNEYIQRFSDSGAVRAINNLNVDLHQKVSYPLGNIVIILVGLPFSIMTGRRKAMTFTSIGIAMAIGFLYFVINAVSVALGKGGAMHPIAAAWLTPFVFLVAAFILIKKKF